MPKIQLLPEELINKIAAGEVIERPASVVKELVENSLDAKSTKITIEIKEAGKELIKVADNGEGMEKEDAQNSILRHATSKIHSADDLFSIHTLGFRGEALASIAAVSKLILTTKKDTIEGTKLIVEGGSITEIKVAGCEKGTCTEVKDLFFNTPARKKFLKTDAVELRHIVDVVTRYALGNPKVAFKLSHDDSELLRTSAANDLRSTVAAIYGLDLAKELLDVDFQSEAVKITGLIAKPAQVRNDKNEQILFVNGRWVKNEDIIEAIYQSYHSLLFVNKHPVFVLNLQLDPQKIDVNVHPAKTVVKIEQKEIVCQAVLEAVQETLRKNNLIPDLKIEFQNNFSVPKKKEVQYAFEPSYQTILQVKETEAAYPSAGEELKPQLVPQQQEEITVQTERFPALKLLGQVHKTFFVAETLGGVYFIDQHAAHERVLYESFMEQLLQDKVAVQNLLQGELVELSPVQKVAFVEHQAGLRQFGFNLEHFGENSYVIKTVPTIFGKVQPKELLIEVLSFLLEGKNSIEQKKEVIITRMSCRAAVMAGDVLTNLEMEKILRDLATKKNPFTCPHGRPTIFRVSSDELEKKFKRRG